MRQQSRHSGPGCERGFEKHEPIAQSLRAIGKLVFLRKAIELSACDRGVATARGFERAVFPASLRKIEFLASTLNDDAGMLGAAMLV
jgi:hypothetical protein